MRQEDHSETPLARVLRTSDEQRTCYRCGKQEQEQQPFRLLPGSTHITLCTACYDIVWGWKEKRPYPASDAKPGKPQRRSAP